MEQQSLNIKARMEKLVETITGKMDLPPVVVTMSKNYFQAWLKRQTETELEEIAEQFLQVAKWVKTGEIENGQESNGDKT